MTMAKELHETRDLEVPRGHVRLLAEVLGEPEEVILAYLLSRKSRDNEISPLAERKVCKNSS